MRRDDAFDACYESSAPRLVHEVYVVTGDVERAAVAVEHAFASAWGQWGRLSRLPDLESWVRGEAFRAAQSRLPGRTRVRAGAGGRWGRRRGTAATQPPADSAYAAHLEQLRALTSGQLRVLSLHHVAGLPMDVVARQLGTSPAEVRRTLEEARQRWGADADGIPAVLAGLGADTEHAGLVRPAQVRASGRRRRRRHTAVGLVTAGALLAVGGALVTQQPSSTAVAGPDTGPSSGQTTGTLSGPPGSPVAAPTPGATPEYRLLTSDMLSLRDMSGLRAKGDVWSITLDGRGVLDENGAYTVCQPRTLADQTAEQVVIRQFETLHGGTTAVQVLEQSTDERRAADGFGEMASWFTTCADPNTQLLQVYDVDGLADQATAVVLRRNGRTPKLVTVGIVRTGTLTTGLISVTESSTAVPPQRVLARLGHTVDHLCLVGGGACLVRPYLHEVAPPAADGGNGFLTTLDLPAARGVSAPWVATDPKATTNNPAATSCDRVSFKPADRARTRSFVVLDDKRLPSTFGLSQTVARFGSEKQAKGLLRNAARLVADCEDREPNAKVTGHESFGVPGGRAEIWRLRFGLPNGSAATYRVGFVRRGALVTEVLLSPTNKHDVSAAQFRQLVVRASHRLGEA